MQETVLIECYGPAEAGRGCGRVFEVLREYLYLIPRWYLCPDCRRVER